MNSCLLHIQAQLKQNENEQKAQWLQSYVKYGIISRGVAMPTIRRIITHAFALYKMDTWSLATQVDLLNQLMRQHYTEDKLAAILYLELYWKHDNAEELLSLISTWFDEELIFDWNVCDWLCVKVLTPLLDRAPAVAIPELRLWNGACNQWKARASLVPFAQSKAITQHQNVIADFASVLIQRPERFCKTAVGWVLREYTKHDVHFVTSFISQFSVFTTREVVRNATKYLRKKT